jgi:hypothetical protein
MDTSVDTKQNFFKHVFNFEDESKADMLNIVQYSLIAIIPVIILNKTMSKYVPEADETKGSLEVVAEVIVQIISMFVGLLIIHRVVTYVPTYSGMKYPDFNIIFIILAVLMITLSLQTKLGEKVGLLFDRVVELWDGKSVKPNKQGGGQVKVSQPISGSSSSTVVTAQNPAMNQALYNDGTSINSLPTATMSPQNLPNYDNMYKQENTPLPGAATPGMMDGFQEPMAASEFLGGGGLGSSW